MLKIDRVLVDQLIGISNICNTTAILLFFDKGLNTIVGIYSHPYGSIKLK